MLEIIGTFILIYLLFRLFAYYILPILLRWFVKRTQKKFYQQYQGFNPEAKSSGPSNQNTEKKHSQKKLDDIGEYVDFEEIKE